MFYELYRIAFREMLSPFVKPGKLVRSDFLLFGADDSIISVQVSEADLLMQKHFASTLRVRPGYNITPLEEDKQT